MYLLEQDYKDWYDVGPSSSLRQWPHDGEIQSPFKERPISPLRSLPSCSEPACIQPDPAHTYAIAGWGKDFVASSLLVMVHLKLLGGGSCQKQLDEAFARLKHWCQLKKKSTSLTELSLLTMKVKTFLGTMYLYRSIITLRHPAP